MKGILNCWSSTNRVITTPTIEAGVSYDVPNHLNIFSGITSSEVCSQRSFFQMLARVRMIEDKEIILLNLSNFKINNCFPWTYEEVKEGMLSSTELVGVEYIEKSDKIMQ